ncbi:MFS transporter [Nocardiopsis alba]|uniref:MFS transporter n=1 Tax=Nocardiopsis alba TaxID=53437 RepID=UPI0035E1622B
MSQVGGRRTRAVGIGDAFSSLRGNRPFQRLWLSNVFFFGGVWTQTLVLGWMAYEMTGSEFLVAVFTAARLAPMLLGPFAGALADRHDRVRLLMVACGWATVALSLVAAFATAGLLSYWGLVAGGLAIGLAQSPSQPARASLALTLVGPARLSNANALNALALNTTQIVGPSLGGLLIATIGAPGALWVSTLWYVLSLLLIVSLRGYGERAKTLPEPVLRMVVGGLRSIGRNRPAVAVLLVTLAANILLWPIYQSFMPVFAEEVLHLDARGLGLLLTCSGVGGLLGSLFIASLGDFRGKGALFVFGTATWGLLWAVFSSIQHAPTAFVVMTLVGLAGSAFGVLQTTLLLTTTEPAVHGRALGLQELAIGVMPLSTLVLGAIAERAGVGATTFVAALILVAFLLMLVLRVPALARLGAPVETPEGGSRAGEEDPSPDTRPYIEHPASQGGTE